LKLMTVLKKRLIHSKNKLYIMILNIPKGQCNTALFYLFQLNPCQVELDNAVTFSYF